MPKYRIRKDGREFGASRLETIRELAVRGLLLPDDAVSVDGAAFGPASELSELVAALERGEDRRGKSTVTAQHAAIQLEVAGASRAGGPEPLDETEDSIDPSTVTGQYRVALRAERREADARLSAWARHSPPESGDDVDSVLEAFLSDLGTTGIQNLTDDDVEAIALHDEPVLPPAPALSGPADSFEDEIGFPPPLAFDSKLLRTVDPAALPDPPEKLPEAPPGRSEVGEADLTEISGGFVPLSSDVEPRPEPVEPGGGVRGVLSFEEPVRPGATPPRKVPAPAASLPPAGGPLIGPPGLSGPEGGPSVSPLSFQQWVEDREGNPDALLSDLGKVDEFLRQAEPGRTIVRFSIFRVFAIFGIGLLAIATWWFTVKTAANTPYPTEDEISSRVGDGAAARARAPARSRAPTNRDATPGEKPRGVEPVPDGPIGSVPADQIERDARLRARVGSEVTDFHDAETLGDALFTEFSNLGCMPLAISVKGRGWRGEPDKSRPTLADIEVTQRGVDEGAEQLDALRDRLSLTWLVLGKYAERGKVSLDRVVVKIEEPSKFQKEYQGSRLSAFYQGTVSSKDLFLADKK